MSEELLDEFAAWCEQAMLAECQFSVDYDDDLGNRMIQKSLGFLDSIELLLINMGDWSVRSSFAWRMAAECEREMNR